MPLEPFRVRLPLTDGMVIERDLSALMVGSVFDPIREAPEVFRQVTVQGGTLVWPSGADLCPDTII